ncbi:hypothetical protein [Confluentibacter sediminis]|uniref:hypothetical protein n=1 Tax=Confluentibacter sediminis TaxID=2219045 RepID=UPI000DABD7D5|nr:hypothetical protein [Confluentibacter sediminis]
MDKSIAKQKNLKLCKIYFAILLFLSIPSIKVHAQTNSHIISNGSLAEKIYLQLDKDLYTTGSTIWLKAILTKSFDNVPSNLSKILYIELINSKESIIEKKLIKIDNGIGQGYFDLPSALTKGTYLIRAYTEWNKNFDPDFFFEKYIQVFTPLDNNYQENAISNVTLIKDPNGDNHLKAILNPFVLDSLHKNKLSLYINIDNVKDSVSIKKEKGDSYQIDYIVPKESELATLELITSNQKKYSKTIVLDENFIDLQFFPESGELVHGLSSKVGFKALDAYGKAIIVEGDILDSSNTVVTSFKSNNLGMGSFELNHVDSNQSYYARLNKNSNETETLYPLPKVVSTGNIITIQEKDKNISVNVSSSYLKNDSIFLNVSFRGVTLYDLKAKLKDGNLKFLFSSNELPEGIIVFKMMNQSKWTVAERLFFNKRLGKNLNVKTTTDKPNYEKRELTNISIETLDINNKPVHASTSVLVINKEQLGDMQNMRDNIVSYFLLSSELKGQIENPGYYFNNNPNMFSDLDALMLTQGWRHYKYTKPFDTLSFKPETSLNVSGYVTSQLSQSKRKLAEITMMTFGESSNFYSQATDSLGNFQFNLSDEFGKDMGIILQSAKESGKKVNYNFFINREKSPNITFNHKKSAEKLDSISKIFVDKEAERKFAYNDFSLNSDDIILNEVVIDAYKLTPNRKKVIDRFGKPDLVIEGKDVAEKEKKWSYGLYSVLMFSFSDKLTVRVGDNGNLYATAFNNEPTLVVIDGIPVKENEYEFIQNIPPSEVSSVEVIEYAKNFPILYCEVFPQRCNPPPAFGNIIAIYTYAQQGVLGAKSPKGIMKTFIPVLAQTKEFYAPKYDHTNQNDLAKPDLRALIHWQPILKTDDSGKAKISFYNADLTGDMMVVIEAITENGDIGYQEYTYKVE